MSRVAPAVVLRPRRATVRNHAGRGLLVLACAGATACSEEVLAHLVELEGKVSLRHGEDGEALAGSLDAALVDGDVVSTGAESRAKIRFGPGQEVELGPDSSLVIRRAGAIAAEWGAWILSGAVRVDSGAGAKPWAVGSPRGTVRLGVDIASVIIDGQQILVRVGEVEIVGKDGTPQRRRAEAATALTVEPLVLTLTAESGDSELAPGPDGPWQPVRGTRTTNAGEIVRTAEKGRASIGDGKARLVLREAGELLVGALSGEGDAAQLRRGASTLDAGDTVAHLRSPGGALTLESSGVAGRAEVSVEGEDSAIIRVLSGKVILESGEKVGMGQEGRMSGGKLTAPARDLLAPHIVARVGGITEVLYDKDLPPVRLSWVGLPPCPCDVEVASDPSFGKLLARTTSDGDGLTLVRPRGGRTYFRVKSGDKWQGGVLSVRNDKPAAAHVKRRNVIDDRDDDTTVIFQRAVPDLTFRWREVANAGSYRLRIFSADDLDKALVDESTPKAELRLAAGKLDEGNYTWMVGAKNAAGGSLGDGRVRKLRIQFDNSVSSLVLRSPSRSTHKGSSLRCEGEVPVGAKLSINGDGVKVDGKGRFSQSVSLGRGGNRLVFRVSPPQGGEQLYVRDVTRL